MLETKKAKTSKKLVINRSEISLSMEISDSYLMRVSNIKRINYFTKKNFNKGNKEKE